MDLGPDGGVFDETGHPKGCVHTTEGTTLGGAEMSFKAYPPHLGYDPIRRIKHQYISLDRCSYAFRLGESDDEHIIQVEVVGFAAKTHTWGNEAYRSFAEDVLKPLEEMVGIPRQHLRFYRADEGIVLAKKTSPIRLRPSSLRAYSGWMGHQHAPGLADNGSILQYGDDHWDPGGFLMDVAFSFIPDDKKEEDEMMALARETDKPEVWLGNYVSRRWVTEAELPHLEDRFGAVQPWEPGTIAVLGDETAESMARRTAATKPQ
jgi:hypothetical protein